jgi:hypothetical protein
MEGSGRSVRKIILVICLDGLRETTEILSQDIRCLVRDLNPGPPEYEAGVLIT